MRRFPLLINPLIAILLLIGACSPLFYCECFQKDASLEHIAETTRSSHDSTRAGDVVINEFMPDPASDWDGSGDYDWGDDEWIELYNRGAAQVDISGWTLDDIINEGTSPYTIPDSTTINPGQFLVFYGSVTNIGLNNAGDWVNLRDDTDQSMDAKSFDHSSDDVSYARIPDGASNWEEVVDPSPGGPNAEVDLELGIRLVTDAEYPVQAKDMIDKASNYVYILQYEALYYPSHPEYGISKLYQSIIDAHGRGLDVKVLFDDTVQENQNTRTYLSGNGVDVKIDGPDLKLHSKLVIADNRVLLGSTNWGRKSTNDNHETNLRLNSTLLGTFFKDFFMDLWADQTVIPSVTPVDTDDFETIITDQYYGKAVEIIDSAQDRIDLIMYHITEVTQTNTLIQKLIDARGRGVTVRVILDKSGYLDFIDTDNMVAMEKLRAGGIPTVFDGTSLNTHAKMLVSDDLVLAGSTNWAHSSLNSQVNTNVLVKNASTSASAIDYFNSLWEMYRTTTGALELSGGDGAGELDFYNGDTVTVKVTDLDMNINESSVEELDVNVLSDSDSTGITLTLTETGEDSGVFDGEFTLSSTSHQETGKFGCGEGDLITVRYHDMMDRNATVSNIEATFTVLQDVGAITLLEPAIEEGILGDSVWLNWSVEYGGDAALTFDLLVDTVPDPVKFAARSVSGTSYLVEDLEDGATYYWKVVPVLDGIPASWESDTRYFDVLIEGVVTLLVPGDEAMVQDYSVKIEWDWDYQGSQDVTFEVYLGLSEGVLDVLVSGISGKSTYVWDLEDGKT